MVANLIPFPPDPDNAGARAREGDTDPTEDLPVPAHAPVLDKTDDRLADLYDRKWPQGISDRVRYDHAKGRWHVWNKTIWQPDLTGEVYHLMADRLGTWMRDAAAEGAKGKIAALSVLLNQAKKESVLKALRWHRGIAMRGDEWDPDPNLLGCENGIVDLRTGQLLKGQHPELLVTRSTHLPYDPEAFKTQCPLFWKFILEITSENLDLAKYLLRVFGYSMFGNQREQKFWVFIGGGQNGKGVLVKTIAHVLGDYAMFASSSMYMRSKYGDPSSSGPRADLMALQGKRFLTTSEPVQGAFNDELVKHHTGDDPIRARALHSNTEIEFRPTHTIVFLTNNPPKLEDVGKSMQRRLRAVHFKEDFTGQRENRDLEAQLREEGPGILSLLIQEAANYHEYGLPEPEAVLDASRAYIEENDPISEFVHDCCVLESGVSELARDLYAMYVSWTVRNGVTTMTNTAFGTAISRRFQKQKQRSANVYLGIRLKSALEVAAEGDQG